MSSGVPQLSLGEKAILTATPDYVRFAIIHSRRSNHALGVWLPRLPTRDTAELNAEVRSRADEDQLA
jgi:hypothetical protein